MSRIKLFLGSIDNPQNRFKAVHIAGTNGKGSVSALLAECLQAQGYKTALFTSPHLISITERIKVNGKPISSAAFKALEKKYIALAKKCDLSFFEYITALAFIYFSKQNVDIAVIETGMGGRLDATNVLMPVLSVITTISYDHQEFLGNTLKKIAFEKAGIIKRGIPVILGRIAPEARSVIKAQANKRNAAIKVYGTDFSCGFNGINWKTLTQSITYNDTNFKMKLLGEHQASNAAVACAAAEFLGVSKASIKKGLLSAAWHGRFDVLSRGKQTFVIDGAHNIQSIKAFAGLWRQSPFLKKDAAFIFGILKDKDYKQAIKSIAVLAKAGVSKTGFQKIIITKISSPRALSTTETKKEFLKYINAQNIAVAENIKEALSMAGRAQVIACVGSLYLAGTLLDALKK
ncbi:MAG: bifunctional folylpolyglutamate synthase/dihydrofolate synthase [Elusimicrobia bacterium]|nr:bifunctional folylpolyglutamate synthase/dihydrofolate synthase [Elusimicrobiota bacterium]